jgi:soluble lytic murein transglycosylase-like protein
MMRDNFARLVGCPSSVPPSMLPSRPCSSIRRRSSDLQRKSHTRELPRANAWLRSRQAIARIILAIAPILCQIAVSPVFVPCAGAQIATRSQSFNQFAKFIAEASARFAVPERWIRAVMHVESGGDERAISSRGALGLMQLMPGTWVELSVRYGIGLDPFDPRDNILAGTAYLKEMHDRFGSAGFLAAYNAGPVRYEQHLATGRSLPLETKAYVAAVTPLLGNEQVGRAEFRIKRAIPWREAPLFVEHTETR